MIKIRTLAPAVAFVAAFADKDSGQLTFSNGRVYAVGDGCGASWAIPQGIEGSGTYSVPAYKFATLISGLAKSFEEADIRATESRLIVKVGRSHRTEFPLDRNEVPLFEPPGDDAIGVKVDAQFWAETSACAKMTDEKLPSISGVYWDGDMLAATDNVRVSRLRTSATTRTPVLLPQTLIRRAPKGDGRVVVADARVWAISGDGVVYGQLLEAQFPILPIAGVLTDFRENAESVIELSPADAIETLGRVLLLAKDNGVKVVASGTSVTFSAGAGFDESTESLDGAASAPTEFIVNGDHLRQALEVSGNLRHRRKRGVYVSRQDRFAEMVIVEWAA